MWISAAFEAPYAPAAGIARDPARLAIPAM